MRHGQPENTQKRHPLAVFPQPKAQVSILVVMVLATWCLGWDPNVFLRQKMGFWSPIFLEQWKKDLFGRSRYILFSKIGVPQHGWFIIQNPIKMDDLGVPLFSEWWFKPWPFLGWWVHVTLLRGWKVTFQRSGMKRSRLESPGIYSFLLFV